MTTHRIEAEQAKRYRIVEEDPRPHTVLDAFLADIIDHPEDDVPRLIYADWLQDHGEGERAEFIRRRDGGSFVGGHDSLGWYPGTHEFGERATFYIRHGFIAEVRCPLAAWLQHGRAIAAAHPIERVRLTDREPADSSNFWCLCHALYTETHQLPTCFRPADYPSGKHYAFPTPEAAYAWASERAILWARGKLLSKEQQHER